MTTYSEANQISIKAYLASKGIHPVKDRGYYGMYHSPFREDSNASMKVDYNKNLWIDFGSNEGGTMIDLVMRINNYPLKEAMEELSRHNSTTVHQYNNTTAEANSFSFHGNNSNNTPAITIQKVIPITHKALTDYLSERKINIDIAKRYCAEIHYSVNNKPFFAIGFQNDSKGWVLRSEPFKGCTSMNITTFGDVNSPKDACLVFEGFMDFLSYLTMKGIDSPKVDVVVLNSIANLSKAMDFIKSHSKVYTYLDNDDAGKKTAQQIDKWSCIHNCTHINRSTDYSNCKDLNEYLVSTRQAQEKKLRE